MNREQWIVTAALLALAACLVLAIATGVFYDWH